MPIVLEQEYVLLIARSLSILIVLHLQEYSLTGHYFKQKLDVLYLSVYHDI